MRTFLKRATILSAAALASGCTSDDYLRMDGLTPGAGNAMAANSAMQMVDPWPNGVQNTKLRVPAVRGTPPGAGADYGAAEKGSQGGAASN